MPVLGSSVGSLSLLSQSARPTISHLVIDAEHGDDLDNAKQPRVFWQPLAKLLKKFSQRSGRCKSGRTLERRFANPDLRLPTACAACAQVAAGGSAVTHGNAPWSSKPERRTQRRVDQLPSETAVLFDERETSA